MAMTPREAGIQAFYADESTTNTLQGLNAAFDAYEAAVGLPHIVEYRRIDMVAWRPIAAFPSDGIASRYAALCGADNKHWEYRVVSLKAKEA